jgi:PKD repeat protein
MRKVSFAQMSSLICALMLMMSAARAADTFTTASETDPKLVLSSPVTVTATASGGTITRGVLSGTIVGTNEAVENIPGLTFAVAGNNATWTGVPTASGSWTQHLISSGGATQDFLIDVLNPNGNQNNPKFGSFTAVPNPVSTGTNVQFTVTATDADGDHLAYYWEFGDDTTPARVQNPIHAYAADGDYNATCVLYDGQRTAFKTIVVKVRSVGAGQLVVSKALIQFDFRSPVKSRAQISGIAVAENTSYLSMSSSWQIINLVRSGYTSFADVGRSFFRAGDASNALTIKTLQTGTAGGANQVSFAIDMKGEAGDTNFTGLFSELTAVGYLNAKVAPAIEYTVPLILTLGNQTNSTTFVTKYTSNKNRKGIARR